jgi:hypothetical protein
MDVLTTVPRSMELVMNIPPQNQGPSLALFMPLRTAVIGEQEGRRVPLMISSEQEYYWSHEWQEGETESEEDLKEGRTHIFKNGQQAAEWLLSDE